MALWTPADLGANLLAWYDASDNATITIAGSGVSQWSDKSGNGHHATQSNDAQRPTHPTSTISFAGSQFLALTGMPVVYDFIFYGYLQWGGAYRIALWGGNGSGLMVDPGELLGVWSQAGFTYGGMSWATNTAAILYATVHNTANVTQAKNGGPLTSAGHTVETSQPVSMCRNDYGQPFGSFYEMAFVPYNSPLDTRQKLEGYLAWKWGNTALLPSDHPYKNAAPTTGAPAGRAKAWSGSAWAVKPVKVWSGSAWVTKPVKVWNGSAWI